MKPVTIKRTGIILTIMLFCGIVMISDSNATNGYFSHGYGVASKSMAGVAAAIPRDALSAATNPAGMAFIGPRYDISVSLFNPNRNYTVTGAPSGGMGTFPLTPGNVESDAKLFLIPSLAGNWQINEKSFVGVSIYGNGGMNTEWPTKSFDNPMVTVTEPTGVNLAQLFVAGTFAHKFAPKHSVGISGIFAYQYFKAYGLQAFGGFSADPTKLTDNDHDNATGFGARVGYMGEIVDGLFIGGSYQTKIAMGEFSEYAGLFAEDGGFDIPSTWTAGIAVEAGRTLTFAADVQQIMYSEIKSIANPMASIMTGTLLGATDGAGFGWEDMTVFKFGLEWEALVDLPFRFGYSFGDQPIPTTEMMFNMLAPGVIEQHITFGFSRKMCKGKELSVSITKSLNKSISGPNPMEAPGAQTIDLEMNQWEFSIGMSF